MKKSIVLAIIHFGILCTAGISVLMLLILFSAESQNDNQAYVLLIAGVSMFLTVLVIFRWMTCTPRDGIRILEEIGATDLQRIKKPVRSVCGRWHNLQFCARFSRPYLEFWPYSMPPTGPRGDHIPSGMEVLDPTNKLRDSGIFVFPIRNKSSKDSSYAIQYESSLSERTFGSWMSKSEVKQIVLDALHEADERLDGDFRAR